jgi:hypothetical protein
MMMTNDLDENIRILCEATRQGVDLPVARPACCHEAWGNLETGSSRIPFYLELNYRTKPQRIKDFFRNLLNMAKGSCQVRPPR